jgi:hypothetical protein
MVISTRLEADSLLTGLMKKGKKVVFNYYLFVILFSDS